MVDDPETNVEFLLNAHQGQGVYRSCDWLERGVFVSNDAVKTCCMSQIGNSESAILGRLDGSAPLKELAISVIRQRNKVRISNQTDKSPCFGCYMLKEKVWDYSNSIETISVSGFLHCNLACGYCNSYSFDPSSRGNKIYELLVAWYESGSLRSGAEIDFGGGEPTFHREFREIAQFAFSHNMTMNIFTNCTAYSPEIAIGLGKGLARIMCSVDAGSREVYLQVKGKDLLDKVWYNLKRYAEEGASLIKIKYILMKNNCSRAEIDKLFERMLEANLTSLRVSANAYINVHSNGKVDGDIVQAAAYMMTRAREHNIDCVLADVFSATDRERIAVRFHEMLDGTIPMASRPNGVPLVDIVVSQSRDFLKRLQTAFSEKYPFRIILNAPTQLAEVPSIVTYVLKSTCLKMVELSKGNAEDVIAGFRNIPGGSLTYMNDLIAVPDEEFLTFGVSILDSIATAWDIAFVVTGEGDRIGTIEFYPRHQQQ